MSSMNPNSLIAFAAALAVFTGIGAGVGTAHATAKAVESIAKQPEAKGDILTTLLVGCGFSEATAVYGLLIGILLVIMRMA